MSKCKITNSDEVTHLDEQRFADSGFFSDDAESPSPKRFTKNTSIKVTKREIKVFPNEHPIVTPQRSGHWLQKRSPSSVDFEAAVHESPSLNHGKFRVAGQPNHHFQSKTTSSANQDAIYREIELDFNSFRDGDRSKLCRGMRKILKTYPPEHHQYIMLQQMEHNFGLQDKIAVLMDTIKAFEAKGGRK